MAPWNWVVGDGFGCGGGCCCGCCCGGDAPSEGAFGSAPAPALAPSAAPGGVMAPSTERLPSWTEAEEEEKDSLSVSSSSDELRSQLVAVGLGDVGGFDVAPLLTPVNCREEKGRDLFTSAHLSSSAVAVAVASFPKREIFRAQCCQEVMFDVRVVCGVFFLLFSFSSRLKDDMKENFYLLGLVVVDSFRHWHRPPLRLRRPPPSAPASCRPGLSGSSGTAAAAAAAASSAAAAAATAAAAASVAAGRCKEKTKRVVETSRDWLFPLPLPLGK